MSETTPVTPHRLSDLRLGQALRGSNEYRQWVCSCGVTGGGYRFTDVVDAVNEWAEHARTGSRWTDK